MVFMDKFEEGERLLELSVKLLTRTSVDHHLYDSSVLNITMLEECTRRMASTNSHIPNFPCYISYGSYCLEHLPLLVQSPFDENWFYDTFSEILYKMLLLFAGMVCCSNDIEQFKSLLQSFISLYCLKDPTILHTAIEITYDEEAFTQSQVETFIGAILEAGGDQIIDCMNIAGQRPLHIVANDQSLLKLLVDHGAHVDAVNSEGKTALPIGTFGVPSLYCTVANAIVKYSLPYQSIGLPPHVVQFVMLHDPECACITESV